MFDLWRIPLLGGQVLHTFLKLDVEVLEREVDNTIRNELVLATFDAEGKEELEAACALVELPEIFGLEGESGVDLVHGCRELVFDVLDCHVLPNRTQLI
jgi:hypothetical protein